MDTKIKRLRESMTDVNGRQAYFFHFENRFKKEIALVSWFVSPDENKQSIVLSIEHGEIEQLEPLLHFYVAAKTAAKRFDIGLVTYLFEQYARNENLYIDCD